MKKINIIHQTLITLIMRARDKKKYPLDMLLAQYGIKTPLVSIVGYLLFITIKVFIWGAACEIPISFLDEQVPNILISIFGTYSAILLTELFIKNFFYPNLYDLISILPIDIFKQVFFKYLFEFLGYKLIFIILDMSILMVFLYFYYPSISIITLFFYVILVFSTHYLTFASYSLLFNHVVKSFRFSEKTVVIINNYFFLVLLAFTVVFSNEYHLFQKLFELSINQICLISFIFIIYNITLCLILECFLDKNLYNDDNN